jgi:hypothetical protein
VNRWDHGGCKRRLPARKGANWYHESQIRVPPILCKNCKHSYPLVTPTRTRTIYARLTVTLALTKARPPPFESKQSNLVGPLALPVYTGGTGHSSGTQSCHSGQLRVRPAGPESSGRTRPGCPTGSGWRSQKGPAGSRRQRTVLARPVAGNTMVIGGSTLL